MDWKKLLFEAFVLFMATFVGFLVFFVLFGAFECSSVGGLLATILLVSFLIVLVIHFASKFMFRDFHKKHGGTTSKLIFFLFGACISLVLLSMIAGTCPTTSAFNAIGQELSIAKKGGISLTSSQVVHFNADDEINVVAVAHDADIKLDQVEFCCSDVNDPNNKCQDYFFDEHKEFVCDPSLLIVTGEIEGKIRTYCPVNFTTPCVIGFRESRA